MLDDLTAKVGADAKGADVRFEVLGPLRVRANDKPIGITAAKQRLLLGLLLTHNGQVVPVETLADQLWGGAPPAAPRNALRWHVHELRRLLGSAERIAWEQGGYRIGVAEDEYDAAEFERLVADGLAAESHPESAAALLNAALGLWRGSAFADLGEHGPLADEAARLDGLRLSALESRVDAELRLGHHERLVGELVELIGVHPWRERLRAQLMIALYRCGRQVEALNVYRTGRERLVRELGLEPGPLLRATEQRILNADPGMEAPLSRPRANRPPAELPGAAAHFTGRRAQAARLREQLAAGGRPSLISGAPGVGKSALALYAANAVRGDFPDGQLYVNLAGSQTARQPVAPEAALSKMLRSLNVELPAAVTQLDELSGRFRSATADKRVLILLDDARDAAQLRPLLPSGAGCGVLATSRQRMASLDDAWHCHLDVLGREESLALLAAILGTDRVRPERQAAQRVVELCGDLPLAVRLAAARLIEDPKLRLADLAEKLSDEDSRLAELEVDDRAVRASAAVSYGQLDADPHGARAARLFRLLGVYEGDDIGIAAAAALIGAPVAEAEELLSSVAACGLLEIADASRYRPHDLLRLFARGLAHQHDTETERSQAIRRSRHFLLATSRAAAGLHRPGAEGRRLLGPSSLEHDGAPLRDKREAAEWTSRESANLLATARSMARSDAREPEVLVGLAATAFHPLHDDGRWQEARALAELAAGAAEEVPDPKYRAFAYHDLATARRIGGDVEAARDALDAALAAARETGDGVILAGNLIQLGIMRSATGHPGAAEPLEEAVSLAAAQGNALSESAACNVLGWVREKRGAMGDAVASYTRAVELIANTGDPYNEAAAVGNLARAQRKAGRPDDALRGFNRAIALYRQSGRVPSLGMAEHLWSAGDVLADLGQHDRSRVHYRWAAAILCGNGFITEAERRDIEASPNPAPPSVLEL